MKKSLLLLTALMALMLVSCDNKEKKVREFATNFATKVLDNDVRQLRMMIPGVDRVDSFSLDGYAADKIVIEKQDDGYNVKLTDNRSMVVKEDEQDGRQLIAIEILPRIEEFGNAPWEEVEAYFKELVGKVNATLPSTHQVSKITVRKEDFKRTGALKVSRNQ